jgi:phage tail-like protein
MSEPLTTFRFEVVLDLEQPTVGLESPLCDAAFAECDGLELTMEPKRIETGGVNDRQLHRIGPVRYGQVTLKRGMTSNLQLWNWFAQGTRPGSVLTAHGQVVVWNTDGTPALEFTLEHGLPVRLRAPALMAKDGLVAIEELALLPEKVSLTLPGGSGAGVGISAGASISAGVGLRASLTGGVGASAGVSATAAAGFGF